MTLPSQPRRYGAPLSKDGNLSPGRGRMQPIAKLPGIFGDQELRLQPGSFGRRIVREGPRLSSYDPDVIRRHRRQFEASEAQSVLADGSIVADYPPIEPFDAGLLRVPDGNEIYWEISGNPEGKPALYLHGGPGSGLRSSSYRRRFDPERYRIVGIDQRGCGRSRPLVIDDLAQLRSNTTQSLIDDIEAVRRHLHIKTWLVSGVSWGTTLALAYTQAHPDRVSEL